MKPYYKNLRKLAEYTQIKNGLRNKKNVLLHDSTDEALMVLLAALSENEEKQAIFVVSDDVKAARFFSIISGFTEKVHLYRSKPYAFFGVDALSRDIMNSRLKVMHHLIKQNNGVVITSAEALTSSVMNTNDYRNMFFELKDTDEIELDAFIERLSRLGYLRVSFVESEGQFSVRGGIIDVFSPNSDNPCRIELFDTAVDSMRIFDSKTQRSIENINSYEIIPSSDVLFTEEETQMIYDNIKKSVEEITGKKLKEAKINQKSDKKFELVEKAEQALFSGDYVNNIEYYLPFIDKETGHLWNYLQQDALLMIHEPDQIISSRGSAKEEFLMNFTELFEKEQLLPEHEMIFKDFAPMLESIKTNLSILLYNNIIRENTSFLVDDTIKWRARETARYYSKMDELAKDLNYYSHQGYKIYLEVSEDKTIKRLVDGLRDHDCRIGVMTEHDEELLTGQVAILKGYSRKGVDFSDAKLMILSEKDTIGTKTEKPKGKRRSKSSKIDAFTDLKPGDYVVHEHHGVGIYTQIEKIDIKGIQKDYLAIHYRGGDKLYVPVDQMDLVQKYIGSDAVKPKINKMSGTEWIKAKAKAQKAIDEMADELIELYSKRQSIEGFAFAPDNEWQREFESSFPHQETEDQLRCINEIKGDMEKPIPMDRLLCGDVGFGKTEVALRAVFKAIMNGKQAVILVPTTILAQQHFSNIKTRFEQYPIKIEMLSRFKTSGQQKKIISDLNKGLVDIVVGTHKLLSNQIKYKDLGILVIDEEQRFGVKHKEMIKQLRSQVDVLTLTATPIPRTLNMSMVGIRDMSLIEEPPGDRYPIQTFVIEKSDIFVKEAITRELSRGGQVYYVHNRVRDINEKAAYIKRLLPEAKIAVAHGQMAERQLENIMIEFVNKEYDVLVCTTIIETGMDIANVNTILIDHADKLGLAQLYQLRGRVGRSNKTAFAYLTYERGKSLTEIAEKRLKAIKEFTEFGSGFKIALRDLEIRGAGNIVGAQQSGHLAVIGYDLYVKMVEKTLKRKKTPEAKEDLIDTVIELDVDGYIPSRYICDEEQKIEIYKKISVIETREDKEDLTEEIIDRFGDMPTEVNNLIHISHIKSTAKKLNITILKQSNQSIYIEFHDNQDIHESLMSLFMDQYISTVRFDKNGKPAIRYKLNSTDQKDILMSIEALIEDMYLTKQNSGGKS